MNQVTETSGFKLNGFVALLIVLALGGLGIQQIWQARDLLSVGLVDGWSAAEATGATSTGLVFGIGLLLLTYGLTLGLFTVQPNEARVLLFLGRYVGSIRETGFWWTNPFTSKSRVSLRVRNFNSNTIKVNDALGSPIEIGAVVVWRVVDSAKALLNVNDYQEFVSIQSETAIRSLSSRYPYDASDESVPSLRGVPEAVAAALQQEVQARLDVAGVEVIEARISNLAYAPEIAQAMLRRQQAQAIIDARRQIVEGAVTIVGNALRQLDEQQIVELAGEQRSTIASNLLVVLTSEQNAQPVIDMRQIRE